MYISPPAIEPPKNVFPRMINRFKLIDVVYVPSARLRPVIAVLEIVSLNWNFVTVPYPCFKDDADDTVSIASNYKIETMEVLKIRHTSNSSTQSSSTHTPISCIRINR